MKRNSRKIIMRVLVFLLLGAIVNVAVAWGCSGIAGVESNRSTFVSSSEEVPRWIMHEKRGLGWQRLKWWRRDSRFVWNSDVVLLPLSNSPPSWTRVDIRALADENHIEEIAFGWPMLAVAISDDERNWFVIWPGFAINTIFYAAILWMLFAFPFVVRRRRRIKRGLCPACAYPVGTSPVCTECGAFLPLPLQRERVGVRVQESLRLINEPAHPASDNPHRGPLPSKGEGINP